MDESPDGDDTDASSPEATDEDVEAAVSGAESADPREPVEEPQRDPDDRDGTDSVGPGGDGGAPGSGDSGGDHPGSDGSGSGSSSGDGPDVGPEELPDEILNAPASAEEGGHTLLEEYERENESRWRSLARQGAFWVVATGAAVAVTLTAVVSLRQSGLSDGLAFIIASVGMALMVGLVFLSLRR